MKIQKPQQVTLLWLDFPLKLNVKLELSQHQQIQVFKLVLLVQLDLNVRLPVSQPCKHAMLARIAQLVVLSTQ